MVKLMNQQENVHLVRVPALPNVLSIEAPSPVANRQELAIEYVVAAVADATFPGKIKGIKPPILAVHLMVL